ncbi:hypothetical protein Tco_0991656 [Tanacetum coccineum]|uniref:Uncharacterized protein n=1 Tax=Tanacetum coccineum TaxID=301880 RepID=A0ABQ5F1C4_9ASTR
MGDVDVMRHLSFDITAIDDHLEVGEVGCCDAVHFAGSCHEGLSHDETFGTEDLDLPTPFDLNIPAHVSTNKGINATSIGEDIHNDSNPQDCQYDVDSRENEGCKDDDDVKIDEEHEIHKDEVEFYLFGIKESDYQFTTIWVSSEVADNVFMEEGVYEMDTNSGGEGDGPSGRRSALNKLKKAFMQVKADGKNILSIMVKFLVA